MRRQVKNLSSEEQASIRKELRSRYITAFLIGIMILIIIHLFMFIGSDNLYLPNKGVLIDLGIILIIILITRVFVNNLKKEIDIGKKKIDFLEIDEKYKYQDRDGMYSPEYTKYVLKAKGKKFIVTEEEYLAADISDYIEVHKSYIREIELKTLINKQPPNIGS
jgi:hypothetical protein